MSCGCQCNCHCHCGKPPRFAGQPNIGTVLAFTKTFPASSRVFGYVALRAANGRWYLTSSGANPQSSPMSWAALVEFIGDQPCSKVKTWEDIP